MENQQPIGEPQDAFQEQPETSSSERSDAVFDDLFGLTEEDAFPGGDTIGVNPQEIASPQDQMEDMTSDSYKFWQSEADKRANERDEVYRTLGVNDVNQARQIMAEMKDILPIAKYVKGNKEVLDVVEASLRGETIGNQQATENQPTQVQQPVKPVQPQGYNDMDAFQDPDSESYNYRASLDQYRDEMIDYNQRENTALRDNIRQANVQQHRMGEIEGLKRNLQAGYGYTLDQANDFVNWANQEESFTMDNLIQLHGTLRGVGKEPQVVQSNQGQAYVEPQVQRKVQEMISQRERLSQPGGVANAAGNVSQTQKPVEDVIIDDMVAADRKLNPWT